MAKKKSGKKKGGGKLPDGWNEAASGEAFENITKNAPIVMQPGVYGWGEVV